MMTPNVIIQYDYEFLLENGEKLKVPATTTNGLYHAEKFINGHGLNLSRSTIGRSEKPRTYKVVTDGYGKNLCAWVNVNAEPLKITSPAIECHLIIRRRK